LQIMKAKDGTPVMVGARDTRKSHRFNGPKTKKEQLRRKGLLGKIPKSEQRLLSLRQREALGNFLEAGLDPTKKNECAIAAGYSPAGNPGQAIDNVLAKPFIRERIKEALEKAGVSYDRIAEVIAEGLEAEHPTAEKRFDPEAGKYVTPKDYNAIARFLKEAIDLHDLRPATKVDQNINRRSVTITLTADDGAAFAKFKRMREEARHEAALEGA